MTDTATVAVLKLTDAPAAVRLLTAELAPLRVTWWHPGDPGR